MTRLFQQKLINNWLVQIPLQLGLSKKDIVYDVRFVNSRIEELYILKNDKTIRHLSRTLNFKKGDVIITAISYKYTKPEFEKILEKFFSDIKIYSDQQGTYALALCKKQ